MGMADLDLSGAVLTVDLDAVVANWQTVSTHYTGGEVAGVVKADAYGTGAHKVAPALHAAGCKTFFVAHADEGVKLRPYLGNAEIHILNGCPQGCEEAFVEHRLIPVLNGLGDIERWNAFCKTKDTRLAADIHADSGMARLGLPKTEIDILADEPDRITAIDVRNLMSHLACADEPKHAKNAEQLAAFRAARKKLPFGKASLCNSAGVFLGQDYHYDLARPGIALYGGTPTDNMPVHMAQVVRLQGKILQVREIDTPESVGYGASFRAAGITRIATLAVGYADGYLRSLSNSGHATLGGVRIPLVGRVSMDLITFDVTNVPEDQAHPGALVDLIGGDVALADVAASGGTIDYEILTSLGARYHRIYTGKTADRA